jgi:hypothetical protein
MTIFIGWGGKGEVGVGEGGGYRGGWRGGCGQGPDSPIEITLNSEFAQNCNLCLEGTLSSVSMMLQLEDNFDWPNLHYLNFVSTNDFMCQEFLHQSTIKKLVQES